jgi:hypothetical protein
MTLRHRLRNFRAVLRSQVIGICRFSYPALGGFQRVHDTPEDRAAFLYAPERLDERFRLFEAFTLPSLRAQTDQNFTYLIVIGQDFPPERLAQLKALTKDMPQVVIQAHPPGRHRTVMADALNSVRKPGKFCIQFRLDDDDAVGVQFVAKLRRGLRHAYPMFLLSHLVAFNFTRGYYARAGVNGIETEPAKRLYLSMAIAIAFRPDTRLTVMNFGHHEVWEHMPTVTRIDPDMWVRGINDHMDSREPIGKSLEPLTPENEASFKAAFGINADEVRAIWRR